MSFFRLRVINTVLFFLTGILIGFILKERFYPARPAQYQPRYQPAYQAAVPPAPQIETAVEGGTDDDRFSADEETPADADQNGDEKTPADYESADGKTGAGAYSEGKPAAPKAAAAEDDTYSPPIVIEAEPSQETSSSKGTPRVLRNSAADFFRRPADFAGSELEMDLQMITAKKTSGGWRLNLVHSNPGLSADYLYVDDDGVLGSAPDLRIGYVYRVRFLCGKGDSSAGNTLTAIAPTGDKASWATGLSAVE